MAFLRKVAAVYLIGVGAAVAVMFILNWWLGEHFDTLIIWTPLDILSIIALAVALIFNLSRKLAESRSNPDGAITRHYLEVQLAFYLTAATAILFMHGWVSLQALGAESLDGNHQAWVIWAAVDVLEPLVLGATGFQLWQGGSRS